MDTYKKKSIHILFIIIISASSVFSEGTPKLPAPPVVISMEDMMYLPGPYTPGLNNQKNNWLPISRFTLDDLHNYHTLNVRVKLPKDEFRNPAAYMSVFLNGFKVYIEDTLIYSYGDLPEKSPPPSDYKYFNTHIIPLGNDYQEKYLTISAYYDNPLGFGDIYSISIGSTSSLSVKMKHDLKTLLVKSIKEIFLGYLLIAIGFFSLIIFIYRWKLKDYPFLSFGCFAICVGIKYSSAINILFILNISPIQFHYLGTLSFLLVPVGLFAFVEHMYGPGRWKIIRRLWQFHLLYVFICLAISKTNYSYDMLTIIILLLNCSICLAFIYRSGVNDNLKIRIPFTVFFLLFITMLTNELLKSLQLVPWSWDLFGWGLLTLVFGLGYTLLEHYTKTFVEKKSLSLELEKNRAELLELQQANLQSQLEALKNQLNPHFLFNNFSTLASIIEESQVAAIDFVQELSTVYRYILRTKVQELVKVSGELDFVKSYEFLLSKRFGGNFSLQLSIPETYKAYFIPPFSLQLLVENAVKHNIISSKKPLSVQIIAENDYLTVINNIQKKNVFESSTQVGLMNIKKRYMHLTDRPVIINSDDEIFSVKMPLLKPEPEVHINH